MGNNEAPKHATGTGEDGLPRWPRLVKLGSVSVVVALAVVLGVAYFTPPEEPAPLTGATEPFDEAHPPLPSVRLPVSAIDLSNEQLQTEAIREIEALRTRFPSVPEALHVAAMTYAGLRQTKTAEEIWRACIQLEPRHVGPRLGLATLLTERGDDQEAARILEVALGDGCVEPEVFYRLATAQTKLGQVQAAEITLRTAVQTFPSVSQNWLLLGQTENQLQKSAEAEQSLRKAIELGNETWTAYFALANACQRQGKEEQAAEYRKRFTELKAKDPNASQDTTFQEIYQRALRPLVASNLAFAAAIYVRQGEPAEGERLFLRALDVVPDDPGILEELASFYRRAGRIADAQVIHQRLVELAPDNVIHLFNLASVCSQLGDPKSAERALEKARQLRPDFALPYTGLAQIHMQLGNLEQARLFAEGAVRRDPTVQGYGVLATICQELGDLSAAENARETARKLAGSDPRLKVQAPP